MSQGISILLLLISYLLAAALAEKQLEMVLEIYRHGARSPLSNITENKWSTRGQLTEIGMKQSFIRGSIIRNEYVNKLKFLDPQYDIDKVRLRSTDRDRTLMSAYSNLLGLFPLGTGPKLPEGIDLKLTKPPISLSVDDLSNEKFALPYGYQPVTILTGADEDELPWGATEDFICPKMKEYHAALYKTPDYKMIQAAFEPTVRSLAAVLGRKPEEFDFIQAAKVYDVLIADRYQNNKSIIKYDSPLWRNLSILADVALTFEKFGEKKLIDYTSTPLFTELFSKIDEKEEGINPQVKWHEFSAHDTNLLLILNVLNQTSWKCQLDRLYKENDTCFPKPPFASLILIEVYKDTENFERSLKIIYNGKVLKVCGDNEFCDYAKLKRDIISRHFVDDIYKVCGLPEPFVSSEKKEHSPMVLVRRVIAALLWFFISILILALGYFGLRVFQLNRTLALTPKP